jgi:hypothetical protein
MTMIPPIQSFDDFEAEVSKIVTPPFKSNFGAVTWEDIDKPGPQHEWLVKNILTRRELSMLAGPSQSGKSFIAIDLAMAIAQGRPWFGRKAMQGGVVYQAGESAKGVRRRRLPAYRQHNDLRGDTSLPFVMLSSPVNLYAGDDQTNLLIEEILHWKRKFEPIPLELTVIDTYAAATPGADENSAKDMTAVLARCQRISTATDAAVLLVHHMNAAGEKPRGHTSIFANLDSVLICKQTENQSDDEGRKIREITIGKLKDGDADTPAIKFVLKGVRIGEDADGDPVTSCVVEPPSRASYAPIGTNPDKGLDLSTQQAVFLQAVYSALEGDGITPPDALGLPQNARVVEWKWVKKHFEAKTFEGDDEDAGKRAERIKKALARHGAYLVKWNIIGRDKAQDKSWIWLTGQKVRGFHAPSYTAPARTQNRQQSDEIPE